MPIIAKNIIVAGQDIKTPAKKEESKVISSISIVRNETVQTNIEEKIDHYHHEKHGDLHKLVNKKSNYLTDMLALEK